MKKLFLPILRFIFQILPLSRFFKIKNFLLNLQGMDISKSARIYSSVQIFGPKTIFVGNDTFIGHNSLINGSFNSKVIIGNYVDISHRVTISTGTHKIDMINNHTAGEGFSKDVIINDGVWIGMNSIILPGVIIGEKSIIAAGSVVINNVPANSIVAGNPAKIKKVFDKDANEWIRHD